MFACWGFSAMPNIDEELTKKTVEILDTYFFALEKNRHKTLLPHPKYQWKYYSDLTIKRIREGIEKLDLFLNAEPQHNWAQTSRNEKFDKGPELCRLPDQQLWSMMQELDAIFAIAKQKESEANANAEG